MLNSWANDIALTADGNLFFYKLVQSVAVGFVNDEGVDTLSSARKLGYSGHVKVTVNSQSKSSGDRRCAHYEHMRFFCFFF